MSADREDDKEADKEGDKAFEPATDKGEPDPASDFDRLVREVVEDGDELEEIVETDAADAEA